MNVKLAIVLFLLLCSPVFSGQNWFVVGDAVNLRSSPRIDGDIVMKLKIGACLEFVKSENPSEIIDGKKGKWVLVNTGIVGDKNELISGWAFDYFLADEKMFSAMDSFEELKYEVRAEAFFVSYVMHKDGTFEHRIYNGEGKDYTVISGRLYRYRNVILAKGGDGSIDIFFFKEGNQLCYPYCKPVKTKKEYFQKNF